MKQITEEQHRDLMNKSPFGQFRLPEDYVSEGQCVIVNQKHAQTMISLSAQGTRLLFHIMYSMTQLKTYIQIDPVDYMNQNKIKSYNTFARGRTELIQANVIAPSFLRGVYHVNPDILFPAP